MGAVFLAEQITMGRPVALKVLKRKLEGDKDIVKRFLREVKAVALLSHPNIITVHDFGKTEDGLLYIAMEYLDGEPLSSAIHRGPVPVVDCLRIVIQICGALGEAHSKGVVHRDLKPDNIMLSKVGDRTAHVHVLDFGIAKITRGTGTTQITKAGFAVGTPEYMSPEQASGDPNLTYASDIYSLGCILYQLLTGKLPFHGYAEMATLLAHVNETHEPPSQVFPSLGIPPAVDDLAMWALEKAPNDRPETALVFARKAEAVLAEIQAGGDRTPQPESASTRPTRAMETTSRPVASPPAPGSGPPRLKFDPPWIVRRRSRPQRSLSPQPSLGLRQPKHLRLRPRQTFQRPLFRTGCPLTRRLVRRPR